MTLSPAKDNTPLAVIVIILTVLLLALGDTVIKGVSTQMRLWQIFVLRSGLALPILLVILRLRYPAVPLMPQALGWVVLRSLMLVMMWISYYAALPHLELSVAAAAYYTLPLFITLFSAWIVGERVTPMGWLVVVTGFVGVLVILRPSSEAFIPIALLPLLSAILYALSMILTRTHCRAEHPLILSFALNLCFVGVGLVATLVLWAVAEQGAQMGFLSPEWAQMNQNSLMALGVMVLAVLLGSVGTAIAYQMGRSSTVATFDFTYVGFATLWGVAFFDEHPDVWTLTGMLLIIVAGVLAVRRAE